MKFYSILLISLTLSFISFAQQSPCDNLPELLNGSEFTICPGDSIAMTVNYNGYDSFQWSDGTTDTVKWLKDEDEYYIYGTYITSNQTINGDFEDGNTGFSSQHIYNATSIWNNATYTVTTDANIVHANLIGLGHGGSGNFLAVNGSAVVDAEIWCQTITVEPNTVYDFSAWISSISPVNPATLQFTIDGVLLGVPFNAPTTTGTWDQFTSTWTSGNETSIEICITNQNIIMNGNDFGLDDIEFIAYCQNSDTVEVEWVEVLIDTVSGTEECASSFWVGPEGVAATAPGTWTYWAPPGGPTNVTISPDNTQDSIWVTVPELGEYIFMYVNGCTDTIYHVIDVISVSPVLNIPTEVACNFDFDISVINSDVQPGSWTYSSEGGNTAAILDPNNPNTSVTVSDFGTYTFTYTFEFCDASFSQDINIVEEAPEITITDSIIICDKEVNNLSATVPGFASHWEATGPGSVQFTDATAAFTNATVSDYGTYTFYYFGCNLMDSVNIEFVKQAPLVTTPNYVDCGLEAVLTVDFEGDAGNWVIQNSEGDSYELSIIDESTAILTGSEYGRYDIEYIGCDTSIETSIVFFCDLIIPNIFTPNNDGVNQEFTIERLDTRYYDQSDFNVFNRWGKKVYHNGQYGLNKSWWDGKDSAHGDNVSEGVYFYTLKLHNHVTGKNEKYSGSINLRR